MGTERRDQALFLHRKEGGFRAVLISSADISEVQSLKRAFKHSSSSVSSPQRPKHHNR